MEEIKKQPLITEQFNAVVAFAKRPYYATDEGTFNSKLKSFFVLFFLNIVMVSLLMIVLSLVETILPESIMDDHKVGQMFNDSPSWLIFLLAAVLAPLWEELVFRFPLKYREWIIPVLFGVLLLIGVTKIVGFEALVLQIVTGVALLLLLVLYVVFNRKIIGYTERLWHNRFPVVFYVFTTLFALIHITNYTISWVVLLIFPILVLPQFAIGIFLGYVRVRFGIAWSIAFHAIHNGLFVGLASLAMFMSFEPIDVKTDAYSLKVNKSEAAITDDAISKIDSDTIVITNHKFKTCLALLTGKDEKLIDVDYDKAAVKLDIAFINYDKKGISQAMIKSNKEIILDEMKKSYGFTFDTVHKTIPHYELYIKDSAKLEKYKTNSKKTSSTTLGFDKVAIENSSIGEAVSALNHKNEGVQFATNMTNDQFYTLNYPVLSLSETEKYFEEHFGIGFKESEKEIEVIEVVFE